MRIDSILIREVHMELRERFEISSGAMHARRVILIEISGDGHTGWGECVASASPGYSYETTDTAWHVISDFLAPVVAGSEVEDARDLLEPVSWVRGHLMAKAGLEMAAWDLEARRRGQSLRDLVGGSAPTVPVGVSIGLQATDEALHEKVRQHVSEGYRKIKIKIKPGRDVGMLSELRRSFPGTPFMADANSAYTLEDADHLKQLDALDLMMVEQPLSYDDLRDHAELQRHLATPVCLDESIRSVADAQLALELGSGRVINIKPGRVGGLASAKAIHDLCIAHDIPVWCGGMLETGIGRAHNLALASLPGFSIPGDISASRRYWERDIVTPEFDIEDGFMAVPDGVGIGVEPDLELINTLTARTGSFEA